MKHLSTEKWKLYRNFTVDKIKNSTVDWDPYWHVYIRDILHPELFKQAKDAWPTGGWSPNNINLNPNRKLRRAWKDYVINIMEHTDIQKSIYTLSGLEYTGDRKVMDGLYEDTVGYAVGNHTDSHTIDIAWQTYLTGATGTNINDEQGNLIKVLPFAENSCWIMRNDSFSFHSCDPVEVLSRRSIMTRYL